MSDEEILDDIPENDAPETEATEAAEPQEVPDVQEQSQPEPAPPQPSVWSAFRSLPEFQGVEDDRAIAQRLYQALEREKQASHALAQYQQVMPVAQQYLRDRPEFEKWRASQQAQSQPQPQPAQQAKPEASPWWNPPKVRDSSRRWIVKDEHGRDTIHAEAPLDAKQELQEYYAYRQDFAEKFLTNPEEALAPMVTRMAQQQAEQIVSQQLADAGRKQYVQTLEDQNKDWLFSDYQNRVVSKEGEAARKYIEHAARMGISDPEARWQYALEMVERDLLHQVTSAQAGQYRQQAFQQSLDSIPQAPPPQAAPQRSQAEQNMEYLRRAASRTANRAGVQTNSPEAGRKGMSFEERLRAFATDDGLI